MPPNPAPHIFDWLLDIGPAISGAMGDGPIEWRDMAAWEHHTGIELDPFEARTIRRLSRAYLAQRYDAKKPDCPPPYRVAIDAPVETEVDRQFKAMMAG